MDQKQLHFLDDTHKWGSFLGFFGLYNLKAGQFTSKITFVVCPTKTIFSVSLIILYSSFFCFQVIYSDGILYDRLKITSLNCFIAYSSVPVAILILLTSLFQSKNICTLLTNFMSCEFTFNDNSSIKINRKAAKLSSSFVISSLISLTCDLFRLYYENWSTELIINFIASYIFAIYSILSVLHFDMLQFWLQSSFSRINTDLEDSLKNSNAHFKTGKRENLIYEDILNDLVPVEVSKKSNWANDIFTSKSKNTQPITGKIKSLRIKYNDVFKIARESDKIFSSRNLIVVAANLIMSIIFLFFTLQFMRQYLKNHEAVTGLDVISSLKGAVLCLGNIWGLVWPCGITCKEARKTGLIIQDHIIDVDDEDSKNALKDFASQLLHENVYFSPHGFFVFENGMLLSILSAVASYLVILLQFHPIHYYVHKNSKGEFHSHHF